MPWWRIQSRTFWRVAHFFGVHEWLTMEPLPDQTELHWFCPQCQQWLVTHQD
jgi:hypothetical protein